MPPIIEITPALSIPEEELEFTATRSGGPGGQHVNKVSTSVTLRFDVANSPSLTEEQRQVITERLASRMDKEGVFSLTSRETRSQLTNKQRAMARFVELLREALTPRRKRHKTLVPRGEKRKRLEGKKRRSELKRTRAGLE